MKSLTRILQQKKLKGEKLFIPYIVAGADGLNHLAAEIEMLAECGASAIEIGVPFSDPVADGPIIQEATIRSLKNGTTLKKIIQQLKEINSPVPLILMGYCNSFFQYGIEQLLADVSSTDVKGMIIPDLPYEHREMFLNSAANQDIALIPLVSLTSSDKRIAELLEPAEGFVYAVTIKGTTGLNQQYDESLTQHLAKLSKMSKIPVLAGFGVSSSDHVKQFNQICDGVIIGSYIVQSLAQDGITQTSRKIKELFN